MKKLLLFLMLIITCNFSSCAAENDFLEIPPVETPENNNNGNNQNSLENVKLKITIGDKVLTAALIDNPTTRDFVAQMPLTLTLNDYGQAEKISDLPKKLSTKDAPSGFNPSVGDITYSSPWDGLAIFYKDRGYASGLIPMARIDRGMEALSGSGSVSVVIDIMEEEEK